MGSIIDHLDLTRYPGEFRLDTKNDRLKVSPFKHGYLGCLIFRRGKGFLTNGMGSSI